ncbi:MAG: MlaD family protein [Chloroflexota bacterium]
MGLRIGGAILGLLVLLIVIGIIFAPHRHTAADGYFKIEYRRVQAVGLTVGSPVVVRQWQIGSVIDIERDASGARVEFHVDPRFREVVETTPAYVDRFKGHTYMRIGPQTHPGIGNPIPR